MPIPADQFAAHLQLVGRNLESADLTGFFHDTARPMVLQSVRDNFTSSVSPDGDNWPPRKIVGDGHPLLIEHGDMMQSAVGGGAGHITRVESRQMALGSADFKAAYHTTGTSRMPPRPFMGASPATEEAIGEKLADHTVNTVF